MSDTEGVVGNDEAADIIKSDAFHNSSHRFLLNAVKLRTSDYYGSGDQMFLR